LHGCHAENLAPLFLLQLLTHDAVDAGADGITRLVDQHAGIVVEPNDAAISSLDGLPGPDNDGVPDITTLDLGTRSTGHALGTSTTLLLHNNDDPVACMWKERNS